MADDTGATPPQTPARNSVVSPLKSTPHAVGSAVVSEYISTVGVDVSDVRPWIGRDVRDFKKCMADEMLQVLLGRCTDPSQSLPKKSPTLLETSLKAVLPLCNGSAGVAKIKQHLKDFCNAKDEPHSYSDFVEAANSVLLELRAVKVPGIPAFDENSQTNILFHVNDPKPIFQAHQGRQSIRRPDIVVVSYESAAEAMAEGKNLRDDLVRKSARYRPTENFQWMNIRSTLEFKRPKKRLGSPPPAYKMDYVTPDDLHMKYVKEEKNANEKDEKDEKDEEDEKDKEDEKDAPSRPTGSTPATGPARTSHDVSNENEVHISERLRSSKKRDSDHLYSNGPPPVKRSRQEEKQKDNGNEEKKRTKKEKKPHPIVQNGLYVAEMFAAHIARLHVISSLVNNDIIYVWYFDRQNTIQCSGINFVQDLPRFMVLLLIMQRMRYKQWGLNTVFEPVPGFSGEITVEDKNLNLTVDLQFDFNSKERTTHFGLRGRATTVFPVKSKVLSSLPKKSYFMNTSTELVAKLFWPEEARQSEPEILEEVYRIAREEPDVLGHVPEMVWFYKFDETSTAIIRRALGFDDAELGNRVQYLIVFKKLDPITTLEGKQFLVAWWQVVKCHRALWRRGVHHRDVSPSNLMGYRLGGRFICVLNDFDLASIIRLLSLIKQRPKGFERTGTVPFMSLGLLTPAAIAGKVEHVYQHDAESFIWVLAWICLRYERGKLLMKDRPLDDWLTVDALGCHNEKAGFLLKLRDMCPTRSHKENFNVAMHCLAVVHKYTGPFETVPTDDEVVFRTWLQDHVPADVREGNVLPGQ